MKKLISISAVLLLLMGAVWVISSCNKDTDTPTTTVTSTEETIISTSEDGAIDRGCSPCAGIRTTVGGGGEATDYTIRIFNRACPTNVWSLVGTWDENTWPLFPPVAHPFNIEHAKTYKIEVTNNHPTALAYFAGFRIYNTSLLTNFSTGSFSVASGATYSKTFSPIANCGCGWIYNCPGPDEQ